MKKIVLLLIISLLSINIFAKCNIIVTTKILKEAVEDIAGDKANVSTLMAVSSCPGHIDLSPSDIKRIQNADFCFYHGFEPVKNLTKGKIFMICDCKNMLIPKYYIQGLNEIYNFMVLYDKSNADYYKSNLKESTDKALKLDQEIQKLAKPLKDKKVICSVNNKSLLIYFGFDVVASYPIPNNITPKTWDSIYKRVKGQKIDFCIDNLQSGQNTSLQLARDINAKHFYTSNFPGNFWNLNSNTVEKCLRNDLDMCLRNLK